MGLPPRIARVLTPPLVQAFRREFPGASIAVAEGLSAQVREWLLAGRVDLALLYDPAPHLSWPASRCSAKTWCWPPPRRSARAARTRRGQDLGAYPLVLPSPPNAIRTLVDSVCRAQGVRLQVAAEVDAVQTIVELAAQGDACAILPRSAAGDRRPSTRWRWPISSPPHRQQPGAGDRPPPSSTRLASATAKLIRGLELRALFAPAKALKCPLRFLVWRLAAVKVPLASHLKQ